MKPKEPGRRQFLREGVALAGLAVGGVRSASGQVAKAAPEMQLGDLDAYGQRSKFVTSARILGGSHMEPFDLTMHLLTPLQDSVGIITPSSLHYVAAHKGFYVPDINPEQHRLMIHGMVDRPLVFTMADLKRFPFVSRIHYLECNGNKPRPRHKTVQEAMGRTSCSEWTGVPLSLLLKEAGVHNGAKWIVAEGVEENKGAMSIPLAKAMDDCLIAYGQNGEPVRPQQGFPLRLLVPGFEGLYNVKWLRRIKAVDELYMTYNEFERYTADNMEAMDPTSVYRNKDYSLLEVEQGPKSVITFPSGGQQLSGRGHYEITGLAWSGGGAVQKVEVSTDGGQNWKLAEIRSAVHRKAHTRFAMDWNWNEQERRAHVSLHR